MTDNTFTIFYDGDCPLSKLERENIKHSDTQNLIRLENPPLHPDINLDKAMHILHGTYHDTILLTLDVTQRLWTLVVKGALVAPIELPIIKQLAYQGYLLRAKYRHRITQCLYRRFAIGTKTCVQGLVKKNQAVLISRANSKVTCQKYCRY